MNPSLRMLVGTLAAFALGGCTAEVPEMMMPPPPQVTVASPLVVPTIEWDRFTGRFEAVEEVMVTARVSGYLESIHFEEGAVVEEGQLLFVIDQKPFRAEVVTAEAGLAEAGAGAEQARAALAEATARARQADAQKTLADNRLQRALKAIETNAISREEVDVRRSEVTQAEAATEAAGAAVAAAEAGVATAAAAIETAKARLENARLQLSYCRITASISGRVGEHEVDVGNFIVGGTGATTLTSIVLEDPIHCVFDASEQEFLKYVRLAATGARKSSREVRTPVVARLLDEEGYPHRGHMDFVGNRLRTDTGTIRGRAIFANSEGDLTPGLFAIVRLPASQQYDAVLVPDAAILPDQTTRFVVAVGEGGTIQRIPVELGPLHRGLRIVRSGLTGEETIIISGLRLLNPMVQTVVPQPGEIVLGPLEAGLPEDVTPVSDADAVRRPNRGGEGR